MPLVDGLFSGTMEDPNINPEAAPGARCKGKPRQGKGEVQVFGEFWFFGMKKRKGGRTATAVLCPVKECGKLVMPTGVKGHLNSRHQGMLGRMHLRCRGCGVEVPHQQLPGHVGCGQKANHTPADKTNTKTKKNKKKEKNPRPKNRPARINLTWS